jgi:protein TonB
VALHAAMLVLAAFLAATRPPPPLPPVLAVKLLARAPAGSAAGPAPAPAPAPVVAAAPPAAVPIPAKAAPAPPEPTAVSLRPKVKRTPPPVPPQKPPEVTPEAAPPVVASIAAPNAAAAPTPSVGAGGSGSSIDVAGLGPGAGGAPDGTAPGGTEDPIELYKALVRARIQAERRYSPMARRRGLEGTVTVRVSVGPSGKVTRLLVEDGAPLLLARATEEAVERAGPFPPPPTGLGVLRIPVRYRLTD